MALPDIDRVALCHHLSERFPEFQERARLARDAGLPDAQLTGKPLAAWTAIVAEADSHDAIARLLHHAAVLRPNDPLLVEMARSASEGALRVPPAENPAVWLRNTAIAGGIVVLLGIGALVGDAVLGRAEAEVSVPVPPGIEADLGVQDVLEVRPLTPPAAVPVLAPALPPAAVAAVAPAPVEVAVEPVADEDDVVADAVAVSGQPCAGPAGVIQGYAYAGKKKPSGSTWVLSRSLNVRRDYPRRDNGWNARAPVTCLLRNGSRVQLVQAPIAVDGGAYWVPIVAGSVTGGR